ncbi:MAG: DUF3040 domain-containing protein [Trebonia sp.]
MSLNAHDRRALARIEATLADHDPRFAASLSAFSRLADGAMPELERIRENRPPLMQTTRRGPKAGESGTHERMHWLGVVIGLSILLALIAAAIVFNHSEGTPGCARQAAVCAGRSMQWTPATPADRKGRAPHPLP